MRLGHGRPKSMLPGNAKCSMTSLADTKHTVKLRKYKPRGLYFSKALSEGLIFGGAYLRRETCVSKSIGLALYVEGNLPFLPYFTLYLREISKYKPPEGLIFGGAI